jgi:uncharacterized protein (TIGR00369 family)
MNATATFTPAHADFERAVRASYARQTIMATLGATLEAVRPGDVEIALAHRPDLCQQHGYLHAGTITTIADSACGYAALSLAPAGWDVLAVEFKINLLRPASAPRFVARGRVLRAGRTLTTATADVFGIRDDDEELVATMLSTIIRRAPE